MIIQICVGSACHLKGSEKIVGLFEDALKKYDLDLVEGEREVQMLVIKDRP